MSYRLGTIQTRTFQKPLNIFNGDWNYTHYSIPIEKNNKKSEIIIIPGFGEYSREEIEQSLKVTDKLKGSSIPQIRFALSHIQFQNDNPSSLNFEPKVNHLCQMEDLLAIDHPCLKVKIGRTNQDDEIRVIKEYFLKNPNHSLRLDANQSFSSDQLQYYWNHLQAFESNIDYFEEPFTKLEDYKNINNIPIAHDELAKEALFKNYEAKAYVIKPSFFGSLNDILKFQNKRIIISHAYESEATRIFLKVIASYWPNEYHGLA